MPDDWRGPEPTLTPRHGAGLALLGLRAGPMVGRDEERTRLWSLLREVAHTGRSRAVRVDGPPGSGVDRMVEWLTERAHETGAAYVSGPETRVGELEDRDRPTVWLGGSPVHLRLAEASRPVPVLLVLCRREHPEAAVDTITLGPMAVPELRLLVANTLAHHAELVEAVAAASFGLPGFAVELLEHWARSGALRLEQGRFELAVPSPPVPPGWAELRRVVVSQAVAGREDVRRVIEVVAAWPGPAPAGELEVALAGWGVGGEALARAAATGLVSQDRGAWRPVSPDVVAAVWGLEGAGERRAEALHAIATTAADATVRGRAWRARGDLERAATELEGAELADVLQALGVGPDDPRLVHGSVIEAGVAFGRGDAERMEAILRTIPDAVPPEVRGAVLGALADLAAMRGEDARWADFAKRALQAGPSDIRAQIAWGRWAIGQSDEASVERLLGFAEGRMGAQRCVFLRLAARAALQCGRRDTASSLLEEVEREDPGNEHTASFRALAGLGIRPPEESLAELAGVARQFRDAGNVFGVLLMSECRLEVLLDQGRREEAWVLLAETERIAAAFGIGRPSLPLFRQELDDSVPDAAAIRHHLRDTAVGARQLGPRVLVVLALRTPDAALHREALDLAVAWDERDGHPRAARWRALRAGLTGQGAVNDNVDR
jgi:hypothetical protein